jgi:hypothetical protein
MRCSAQQQQRRGAVRERRFTVEIGMRFPEARPSLTSFLCLLSHASLYTTLPAEQSTVQSGERTDDWFSGHLHDAQARHSDFGAKAREILAAALAAAVGVPRGRVAFEGVRRLPQKASPGGLIVQAAVETGPDILAANALVQTLKACARHPCCMHAQQSRGSGHHRSCISCLHLYQQ